MRRETLVTTSTVVIAIGTVLLVILTFLIYLYGG
jgi:hypothetical protein